MRMRRDSLRIYGRTGSDASLSLSRLPTIERRPLFVFRRRAEGSFQPLARLAAFPWSPSDAGGKTHRGFCPDCGSPILAKPDAVPHLVAIRTASLDDPSWFNPQVDVWTSDAHSWDQMNPALPKFEKYPPQAPPSTGPLAALLW